MSQILFQLGNVKELRAGE
ncbi:hypothetical protein TNIN_215661, partial [Trichonephila inaurata madagascariensis]